MNYQQEIADRAKWIKDFVDKSGAKGVMLGLSGGKDSATVAGLCAAAGVKIYGTYMPINSNPNKDMPFIDPLIEKYGIEFISYSNDDLVPIWNALASMVKKNQPDGSNADMAIANVKARMRMTILYGLAQVRNLLVVGTDNASEAFVGYFTKWGDGAYDFCPISDLTVDEVVALGDALGIPKEITHRVPSAGLWDGQTDENELGVTYADIGKVINGDTSVDAAVRDKILSMHRKTEHKRNPIPIFHR